MAGHRVTSPIGVAFAGLSRRSIDVLVCALRERCDGRFVLRLPEHADVAIVHVETNDAGNALRRFRDSFPQLPVVLIGKEPPALTADGYVPVPIQLRALTETLTAVVARIDAGNGRDVARTFIKRQGAAGMQAAVPEHVHFDLEDTVLGVVLRNMSGMTGRAVAFQFADRRTLVIDHQRQQVISEHTPRALAECSVAGHTAEEILRTALPPPGTTPRHLLDQFLWELAVHTSNGRLPAGIALDAPLYLARWPDFTQLFAVPGAMRIVSLWVLQPRSLLSLYHNLRQPFEQLFTVYTACRAIGLAGVGKRQSDTLLAPATMTSGPRTGLVEAVRRRFVRFNARERR